MKGILNFVGCKVQMMDPKNGRGGHMTQSRHSFPEVFLFQTNAFTNIKCRFKVLRKCCYKTVLTHKISTFWNV